MKKPTAPAFERITQSLPLLSISAAMLAFALLGSAQALYGSALPAFSDRLSAGSGVGGLLVGAHWTGALASVLMLLSDRVQRGIRSKPMFACGVLGFSAMALATTTIPAVALAASFGIGFGYGWLTVGLNGLFARAFGEHRFAMVNALNAAYGVGAVLTPALVSNTSQNPANAFLWLGITMLVVAGMLRGLDDREATEPSTRLPGAARSICSIHSIAPLAMMASVIALESSLVSWSVTALEALGTPSGTANMALSGFFVVFLVSRILAVFISGHTGPLPIVIGALVVAAIACVGMATAVAPVTGFVTTGVVGALFPNAFSWGSERLKHLPRATPVIIVAAFSGGIVGPSAIGLIQDSSTPSRLPVALTMIVGLALAAIVIAQLSQTNSDPVRGTRGN